MSTLTTTEPVTGPVFTEGSMTPPFRLPAPRPVHLVNGCNNAGGRARSTDPLAVSCRACHATNRWVNQLVTRLTSLDIRSIN